MRFLRRLIGLAIAATLFGVSRELFPEIGKGFDPFLIFVLYQSLERRPAWSMFDGCAAGLIYDALSGGLFGLYGIANTLVGFTAARLQQRLVVQRASQVALVAGLGTALQQALLAVLYTIFLGRGDGPDPIMAGLIMLLTAFFCMALYALGQRLTGWLRQRREKRGRPTLETL